PAQRARFRERPARGGDGEPHARERDGDGRRSEAACPLPRERREGLPHGAGEGRRPPYVRPRAGREVRGIQRQGPCKPRGLLAPIGLERGGLTTIGIGRNVNSPREAFRPRAVSRRERLPRRKEVLMY